MTSSRAGRGLPARAGTSVRAPADVGLDAVGADQGAGVVQLVQADPQPVRPRLLPAGRRVHGVLEEGDGAEHAVVLLDLGVRVEMPEVCSHWRAQSARSRPEAALSAASRSARVVLP